MFALTFITYLDRVCISATAAPMMDELGMTKTQMGQVLSAFVVGYVLFEIPGGWLADRYGARSLLTRIVVWWSTFTALTGVAWNFASLLVIRFLFGCGEAGAFPGCASALSRWFPRSERGRAQAVIMVGSRLGGAFGDTAFDLIPRRRGCGAGGLSSPPRVRTWRWRPGRRKMPSGLLQ